MWKIPWPNPFVCLLLLLCPFYCAYAGQALSPAPTAMEAVLEVNIDHLKSAEGEFQYPNLPWLSSPPEVELILGFPLGEPKQLENPKGTFAWSAYYPDSKFSLMDHTGTMEFEFRDGQLRSIAYQMRTDEPLALFEALSEEISDQFGRAHEMREGFGENAPEFLQGRTYASMQWNGPTHQDGSYTALTLMRTERVVSMGLVWVSDVFEEAD